MSAKAYLSGNKKRARQTNMQAFLRDWFVRDHRSMVSKVWGARERLAVAGISDSTLIFIFMITIKILLYTIKTKKNRRGK